MKITNHGNTDSGAGTAGFKAHKKGLLWDEAESRWIRSRKNSRWITQALRAFRQSGGYVPASRFPEYRAKEQQDTQRNTQKNENHYNWERDPDIDLSHVLLFSLKERTRSSTQGED